MSTSFATETSDSQPNYRPFVSVIVPVRNGARFIRRCIEALLAQTYPRECYEIIVVDNGSTDDTRDVIASYPVTLFVEEGMPSPYPARNLGIRHARGELFAFTDADCVPVPRWLEAGVTAIQTQGADMACGLVSFAFSPDKTTAEVVQALFDMDTQESMKLYKTCPNGNLFAHRRVFDQMGLFLPHVRSGGDIIWTYRATHAGFLMVHVPEAEVLKATRKMRALLKQQYRKGRGQALSYRVRGQSGIAFARELLHGFLPLTHTKVARKIRTRGSVDLIPRFLEIWLGTWPYNLAQNAGRIHGLIDLVLQKKQL
jgi:glycosyltransferase involved in cell wall biosynthesis